jgi:hypothetical protein
MASIDAGPRHDLLAAIVRDPSRLNTLPAPDVGRLIDAAEQARLRGWLLDRLVQAGLDERAPSWLRDRIDDARAMSAEAERQIRWEVDRLHRAFDGTGLTWLLLKGGAYLMAGLPPGRGRQVADLDLLVPEAQLLDAERLLRGHGWEPVELDRYDERYYRDWMHELPPLVHVERGSVVDLHHAILPRTSRLHPSSARLLDRAVHVGGDRVLAPAHMVLHAAAHLFHDGEVAGAIRDLVDIDGLITTFARDPAFWPDWLAEAGHLQLQRPAFYALRYAQQLAGTRVPADVQAAMRSWAPPAPVGAVMDRLVARAISGSDRGMSSTAAFGLYVRSHWLRMPAPMLVRHLARKAWTRA